MPTTTIRVDSNLLQRIERAKPDYLSTAGFFQLLAEQGLQGGTTLSGPSPQAGTHQGRGSINKEEEERAHALSLEAINHPPAKAKPIDPALELHCDLIRDFWKTKKGSKGDRSWNLLQTGLKAIQKAYGDSVVKEQLELAINGRWQSITLANYERFRPTKQHLEPVQNHPAQKVFRADDLGPEWDIPSATGGKGVLEGLI